MKHTVNVVSENNWLTQYKDKSDMDTFIHQCLCDGAEVLRGGEDTTGIYTPDNVIGCHLYFSPDFLDFWRQDIPALLTHFHNKEEYETYYRAKTPEEQMKHYQDDMDYAEKMGAEYVVMHVNDVSNEEILSYSWLHSNEEVIRGMAELVNCCTKGKNYHFKLLFENLFTPGMDLLNPKETELMLSLVDYENKGILMDTGHLMCASRVVTNESEGIDFVLDTVKKHGELAKYIRGLHLHKSTTADYIRSYIENPKPQAEEDFYDRFNQTYSIILNIDQHRPFETSRVKEIIEKVEPDWVCHEISARSREEKLEKVLIQMHALGKI